LTGIVFFVVDYINNGIINKIKFQFFSACVVFCIDKLFFQRKKSLPAFGLKSKSLVATKWRYKNNMKEKWFQFFL